MRGYRTKLGPKFSEGSRLMWLEVERRGWSMTELSKRAGWASGMAYRYMFGDRRPDRETAVTIQRVLGIDPGEFDRDPRKKFLPPAARAA